MTEKMYELIEFKNEKEYTGLFLSLPYAVYKGDKNYVRLGKNNVKKWLTGNHACSEFLKQKNLIVLKGGLPVARGIAFVNEKGRFGSIGFFECYDDAGAVKLLVEEAKAFCKANNVVKLYAPMNGSIWGDYRIMTKGFEDRPYLGEPYNKPYYYDVLAKCGFIIAKRWESQFVKDLHDGKAAERFLHIKSKKSSGGLNVRGMQNYDKDIRILYKLVMNSFAGFFLFHELDEQTFLDINKGNKRAFDKRTVRLALDKENKPVGFGLAFPDYRSKLSVLFKYAKRYILLYYGTVQEDGKTANPLAFRAVLVPVLQFIFSGKKGCISAMMSEDSKALNATKTYDYTHEYVLLETEI